MKKTGSSAASPASTASTESTALRHDARLQPLAKAITPGPAPEEALQALGADSAERDGTAA